MTAGPGPQRRPGEPDVPPPLTVAASLVGVEAFGYLMVSVTEFAVTDPDNPTVGITTGIFFLALAVFLVYAAWRLWRLSAWARAPIVLVQIMQIPVGISFWGGATSWVTIVAVLLSVIVLAGVFNPDSVAALHELDEPGEPD